MMQKQNVPMLGWNIGQSVNKLYSFGSLQHNQLENMRERAIDGYSFGCKWDTRPIDLNMANFWS